jgi:2-phospho-L-lactate guanylyltransferase
MLPTALVPVRMAPVAKRRLAHVISPAERSELIARLFGHVVNALEAAGLHVVALSPHPIDAPGLEVWRDTASGLNRALHAAIGRAGTPVLVVHADLPHITPDDVHALLDVPADVVIARAHDGGTNALMLRKRMRPAFGTGSALAHAARARDSGLSARVLDRSGLALDVDDEATLTAWRASSSRSPRP